MERVNFTFKSGHTRAMNKRQAELLNRLGQGQYLTRDMVAGQTLVAPTVEAPRPVVLAVADELEAMDKEQLHALAKERGVKVHHMAGADKVRTALREAA